MFTNLLLGASLLSLVSLVPPNVQKVEVLGERTAICPGTQTTIQVTFYKVAGDEENEVAVVVWTRGGIPVAALDVKEAVVYVYKEKKEYPLSELRDKYPTPCDIPHVDL